MPPQVSNRKSRLDLKDSCGHLMINELVQVQQHVREVRPDAGCLRIRCAMRIFFASGRRPRAMRYARSICCAGSFGLGFRTRCAKSSCLTDDEIVIEQHQRLRGNGGYGTGAAGNVLVRQVEGFEQRERQAALSIDVYAATPDLRPVFLRSSKCHGSSATALRLRGLETRRVRPCRDSARR